MLAAGQGTEALVHQGFEALAQKAYVFAPFSYPESRFVARGEFLSALLLRVIDGDDDHITQALFFQYGQFLVHRPIAEWRVVIEQILAILQIQHRVMPARLVVVGGQ